LFEFSYQWQYRFYAELISYAICTYFFILFWSKKLNLSYSGFDGHEANAFLIKNINIALGAIPRTLLKWYRVVVDRQYLFIYIGMYAVGEFTVATQIATMLTFPFMIISTFFSPLIVKNLSKHNYKSFIKFIATSFIFILLIMFFWSHTSKYFLEIYIGKELVHLSDTIMILMLSLFLMLISSVSLSFFTQSGLSSKRYDFLLLIFILAPVMILFLKPMDITNVAYINLLVSTIYFVFCIVESIRLYKISFHLINTANKNQ
jgi:O-antigen/teichoic acid export membrane protein